MSSILRETQLSRMTHRVTTTPSQALVDQVIAQTGNDGRQQSALPTILGAISGLFVGLHLKVANVTLDNFGSLNTEASALCITMILALVSAIFYRRLPYSFQFSAITLLSALVAFLS